MLPDDSTCIRIEPDKSSVSFFQRVLLPELTAKYFSEPVVL